jgi:Mg-chelatase subunit ChlD
MSGLKKIGRNHGHCPYTPYEDIPQDSKQFAINYMKQKEEEKDTVIHGKFRDLARKYNSIAEDYNKFVWLAKGDYETAKTNKYERIHLLKAKREPDIFNLSGFSETTDKESFERETDLFDSMEGYAHNNLILLLDVSQSMNKPEKLPLLKKSFKKLLRILRQQDKVAVVTYSGEAKVVLKTVSCAEKEKIITVIDNLSGKGSTNIENGLKTAYKLAKAGYVQNGNNRIILATDGEFEVNDNLYKTVRKIAADKIALTIFHYGKNKGKKMSLYELSMITEGNYELITDRNSDAKLVKEAKAIKIQND